MAQQPYSICICDSLGGSYLSVALKLAGSFKQVYYYSVNQSPFPNITLSAPGTGYESIIHIQDFWSAAAENKFDIVMFTDIYFEGWADAVNKLGIKTIGGSKSGLVEMDKNLFMELQERLHMDIPPYTKIAGTKALKNFLSKKKNQFVKLTRWRGQMETFFWKNASHSQSILDQLTHDLGPLAEDIEYQVQPQIDAVAEIGSDTFSVNGLYPDHERSLWGCEIKDSMYVGKVGEILPQLKQVLESFAPVLKSFGHKGPVSTEVRQTKTNSFFTDPTLRCPAPPTNCWLTIIENLPELLVGLSNSTIVAPVFKYKYVVELILKSNYTNDNYLQVDYPTEYKDNLFFKGSFIRDNKTYIIPFGKVCFPLEEFGSVVVGSNILEEAISKAIDIASQVEGYDVRFDGQALDKAKEAIDNLNQVFNIKF